MLPFLTEHFGNPSGSHRAARVGAQGSRRVARGRRVAARRRLERSRVHRRRHRGRQPGRDRRARRPRRCRGVLGHRAPRGPPPRPARGGRIVGVDASGTIDLDALAEALDDVGLGRVGDDREQRGRHDPADRARRRGDCRARARRAVLHTDAIQAFAWLDVAEVCASARARVDQRPQVRRTEGRRRARHPQGSRARAAGARWWPGARPSQRHPERRRDRRAGDCDDVGERRAQGDGRSRRCAARLLGRRAAGAMPTE